MMAHDNVLPLEGSSRVIANDDHQIGAILVDEGKLKEADLERIVDLQHRRGLLFGEAARRLGLLDDDDVTAALDRQYGLPQLLPGDAGASPELIAAFQPRHPCTEELRGLRTQLLLRWFDMAAGRRSLAITSPGRGDGRSCVAANLAIVFSQLGLRTLLIDADLRHPRQHQMFNTPNRIGLAAVLAGRTNVETVLPVAGCPKLSLLPAGAVPPNPQELLSRPRLGSLLDELAMKFDLILLDTSAAQSCADARSVAFRAGNALVIARRDHTRIEASNAMLKELNDTGTRVVGTVINAF
ncbi:MAG TPA: chain length determinant protein tyrosine kinase EpsG [Azonexus sp.]